MEKNGMKIFIAVIVLMMVFIIEIVQWKIYPIVTNPEQIPPPLEEWHYALYVLAVILTIIMVVWLFIYIVKPIRIKIEKKK